MVQPRVVIDQGELIGSIGTDVHGDSFYKFQGIPYAKPPIGELRFKAPVPPEKWSGVFDASKEGDMCYSRDPLKNGEISGSENCLVLNVYTKQIPDDANKLRPVLVWVHGGGFFFGSGNEELYGPNFLITENIVLVTFNYRLGLLGFISFDDPSLGIPGNAGLKDQIAALRWVQKNISKFGGDPNNVTIFGESAGGFSVHLLVLSPMGKGLFHKAIAQSGCAVHSWGKRTLKSEHLALTMGTEGADERVIYDTLMEKSVEEILKIQDKLLQNKALGHLTPFGYVIETNSSDPFMTEEPMDIIHLGKFQQVPFMLGYTTAEGMIFELFKGKVKDFKNMIPANFGFEEDAPQIQAIAKKIQKFYSGDAKYFVNKKFDLLSDSQFIFGMYLTLMSQYTISKAPTYLYRMSIETNLNFLKKFLHIESPGTCHLDDVGYLFNNFTTPEILPGSVEETAMLRFVKLWTNFAKFGNPTPDKDDSLLKVVWKPVTDPEVNFLDIGNDLVALTRPDAERIKFWTDIFNESPAGKKYGFLNKLL